MTALRQEQCTACRADAPRLTQAQLVPLLGDIPEWNLINVDGVQQLQRSFSFKNFVEALRWANAVGELAEQHQHHPSLLVEWGKVTVTWWTHKIKGLHRNDTIMAAKTDALA